MAKIKNKQELISKIKNAEGFSNEEKSQMLALLNENKTYGLVWEKSTEDAWEMMKDYVPVLKEDESKRIDHGSENPNHILIEGDNLNALTALSYTHEGKVDVIYIDPPYNTGNNDFVYNDKFIGEDDSYRHSKWLSFMEKRLKIAKRLMSEKAVIFISIDDNEQANLKLLCNATFGEDNFLAQIIWERAYSPIGLKKHFSESHDYILVYANNINNAICNGLPRTEEANSRYTNPDNDPRGPWTSGDLSVGPVVLDKVYEIITPSGRSVYPPNGYCWRLDKNTFSQYLKDNRIWFGENGANVPRIKRFLSEVKQGITPMTIWKYTEVGHSQDATKELKDIFEGKAKFTYPKSVRLIQRIVGLYSNPSSTVLDFFAGSGTALHATMQLNAEDGGHRQCILVTNNENNICEEVTYERNKRVIEGYTKPNGDFVEGLKNNNLRYFKVGFTPREKTDENMFRLAKNSVNLLRIKHDVYKETQLGELENPYRRYRYFEEDGKQLLVILDTELIGDIVEQLEEMEVSKPIPTYVFATGAYPFTEDFESVADKVELYPLPHGLYQACERNMPKMIDKEIENPEGISLSNEELETSMDDLTKEEA